MHKEGSDVVIFACGVMVSRSIEAAEELSEEGIEAAVVDIHTLKPLDANLVIEKSKSCGCVVTVEDHSVIGGLGGAISECLSKDFPVPVENVGVQDKYGQSVKPEELMKLMGLTVGDIVISAKKAIKRGKRLLGDGLKKFNGVKIHKVDISDFLELKSGVWTSISLKIDIANLQMLELKPPHNPLSAVCLLYTSDAADE